MRAWHWICVASLAIPAWGAEAADGGNLPLKSFGSPGAAFDNDRYRLGYQVYLANHNLTAAFEVARKASQSRPDDIEWLRRYASAAEWVGQPAEALDAWLKLARRTDDKAAWASVGRLAPGLLNDNALLAYQQRVLQQQGPSEKLVKNIAATYERLGQADDGLAFVQSISAQHHDQYLFELEATLAEHAGHDEQAVALLHQLNHDFGPRESWLLRLSELAYSRGQPGEALADLEAAAPQMPPSAAGFWETYAGIASQQGHDDEARKAYQVLLDSGHASATDLMAYVSLMQNEDPLAAARLSETVFRKFGDSTALLTALYLYQREDRLQEPQALLASLKPEQLQALERNADFLQHRGLLEWRLGQFPAARHDYEHALLLQPGNVEVLQNLVQLVMDQHDTEATRQLLLRYAARAQRTPVLWPEWASGWNLLDQPHEALPYLQAYCRANPDDSLAELHLADTYEKWGEIGKANSLRLHVLRTVNMPGATAGNGSQASPERLAELQEAMLALRLDKAAPDPGLQLLRRHLKRDAHGRIDPGSRELALSWLLAHDNGAKAERWMNLTYPEGGPGWARAEAAQSSGDTDAMRQLLANRREPLPPQQEAEMTSTLAEKMNWPQLEESSVFAGMEQNPDDAEAAQRYRELASAEAPWAQARVNALRQGGLDRIMSGADWSGHIGGAWRLQVGAGAIDQSSHDPADIGKPASGSREQAAFSRDTSATSLELDVANTKLWQDYASAGLRQSWHPIDSLDLHWSADYNADAPESAPLLAAGTKDQLGLGAEWTWRRQWFVGGDARGMRFQGEDGEQLGHGDEATLEFGRHFQLGTMPQTLKLEVTDAQFTVLDHTLHPQLQALIPTTDTDPLHFYVPTGYRQVGAFWEFGDSQSQLMQTRWRAFGSLGPVYANTTGMGYEALLGGSGPVLGHDRAALSIEQEKGGQSSGSTITQVLASYRYYY